MKRRFFLTDVHPLRIGLLLCVVGFLPIATLNAGEFRESRTSADARAAKIETPLFVLNFAGVARILDDVDTLFRSVKRGELALGVRGVLALSGDLKGIDRTRPIGLMTFINPGEAPEPVAVAYIPVSRFDDLRQTLKKISQVTLSAAKDRDGTFALSTPTGTFRLVQRGKYIFIARQSVSLRRDFGDPAVRFATLTRRHDLAIEFRLSAVPIGLKTMTLDYLRASVDSKLRTLRGEPASRHRFRREATLAAVSLFERVLLDGERLTFGWNLSKKQMRATLDLQLVARPATRLAKQLQQRSRTRTPPSFSGDAPLTASASWRIGQTESRLLSSALQFLISEKKRDSQRGQTKSDLKGMSSWKLISAGRTASLRLRLDGKTPGHLLLIGALALEGGKSMPKAVSKTVAWLRRRSLIHRVKNKENAGEGIVLRSRFQWTDVGPALTGLLGETPSVILDARSDSVHLIAGDQGEVRKFQKQDSGRNRGWRKSGIRGEILRVTVRLSGWLPILQRDGKLPLPAKVAKDALSDGKDGIRLRMKTGEGSLTFNTQFDVGVVRFVMLALIRRFERQ